MTLHLKAFISEFGSCAFEKVVNIVDNKINLNDSLKD